MKSVTTGWDAFHVRVQMGMMMMMIMMMINSYMRAVIVIFITIVIMMKGMLPSMYSDSPSIRS